ncbi:MAG: hypothetical protein ACAI34_04485 [Verrucomicrobium sp.]
MTRLRAVVLSFILSMTLCQCSVIRACARFFKDHASQGHNSSISGNLPPHPITLEEFSAEQARRGLPPETITRRFRVADANDDGLLTPEEVQQHRIRAEQNKRNAQSSG